jgi:hypothetical protein
MSSKKNEDREPLPSGNTQPVERRKDGEEKPSPKPTHVEYSETMFW